MYTIIDIETTGGRAERDRIIEIAIITHDGEKVLDEYSTLVNPEMAIPSFITGLTGITNDMVRDAPKFYEVAREIVERTQGRVFVAHNARFDYSFVQTEFRRLGYRFSRKQLCTCKLSRKLMPETGRHNLDTLIKYLDIEVPAGERHRALGDTRATAILFEELMRRDGEDQVFSQQLNLGVRETRLPENISIELLHSLPEETGVYYFYNQTKDLIYVGKSINIKKRVMEHFTDTTQKGQRLQQSVADISFEVTGSELAALLLESKEIKTLNPVYNRQQRKKNLPAGIFVNENDLGYRCLMVDETQSRRNEPIARFERVYDARRHIQEAMMLFELCSKWCNMETSKPGACSLTVIGTCKGACTQLESVEEYNSRVEAALAWLSRDFTEDYLLVDFGRFESEMCVFLIEDGILQGYAYLDRDDGLDLETLRDCLQPFPYHKDYSLLVKGQEKKDKRLKKIAL